MVVLKNCEPEVSYILAELFNKCLKKSCFLGCWKVSSVVPVFKNCDLFSDFQYGFRSSRSTADLLTVVSDRIARAFNRSGLLELWHLIYPRLLTGFGMLVFFTNLRLMEFQIRYFALFLLFSVIDDF